MSVMVHDIGFFNIDADCPDFVIENGDLKGERGLQTAVLISLFSDMRTPIAELPQGENSQRGWWGDEVSDPEDDQIGSMLWLTSRAKTIIETANQMEEFAKLALQWMIDDGVAQNVTVSSEIVSNDHIKIDLEILKPEGDSFFFRFVWDGQKVVFDEDAAT